MRFERNELKTEVNRRVMLKYVLALSLATGFLIAQEEVVSCETMPQEVTQGFGYLSIGLGPFPVPLPAFTGGYRSQAGHHGFDASLQVQTVIAATQLKTNLLYHYYPKPCLRSQSYYGIGVGPSVVFKGHRRSTGFLISPEFVFGKQYRNETDDIRFFQAQVSFPTFGHVDGTFHHSRGFRHLTWFPLVIISYGWGF